MFRYDLTIIVPIFNAENFIKRAIGSMISQSVGKFTYEILLLNDGSTDSSEKICLEYSDYYHNIKYFYHKKKGVSATRNIGLDKAKGKYILFLDADDELKPDTLIHILKTFEEHEDVADLLVYPLYTYDGKLLAPHVRNQQFFNTSNQVVFSILDNPYLNQCTMNVVIRNLPKDERVYFDESLSQSEDALFNTTILLRKKKILFSRKGGYIYHVGHFSTVDRYKNPVDIGDMLLYFFENLLKTAKKINNQVVPRYVQSMILYEFNWRFKQGSLFPYHLSPKNFTTWEKRLETIFKDIEVATICQQRHMDFYHKMFIIQKYKGNLSYQNNSFGLSLFSERELVQIVKHVTLVFNKIKRKKDCLQFVGYIKSPWLHIYKDVSLFISQKSCPSKKINLGDSSAGYYKAREKIANFYAFEFKIPLIESTTIGFDVQIDYTSVKTISYFEDEVIFNNYIGAHDVIYHDFLIQYENSPFKIIITRKNEAKSLVTEIKSQQKQAFYEQGLNNIIQFNQVRRFIDPFFKCKKIWLYNDRVGTLDNAYEQFQHDIKKKDGVLRYYVIRKEDLYNPKFPQKNCVLYGSLKHKILFFYSEYILTSFKDRHEYSPFSNRAYNIFYSDFKFDLIYLQHGVLNAHTPWLYGKHKTKFDKFLISSSFEKENLIQSYGYLEKDLLLTGMPRLDLSFNTPKKKKILFAPSWRKSLLTEDKNLNRTINKSNFYNSDFYKGINSLIHSHKLNDLLEQYGYILDVKMHPIFIEKNDFFQTPLSNIHILQRTDPFDSEAYQLFITDFSSFLFDFIKNKTKMVFFFPDYNHFTSGNHIYRKLDLDTHLFGPRYTEAELLIQYIKQEIKNDFALDEKTDLIYQNFYYKQEFFSHKEALYNALKQNNLISSFTNVKESAT